MYLNELNMGFLDLVKRYSAYNSVYGTDKLTTHAYDDIYETIFEGIKKKEGEVNILEIGVFSGAFLQCIAEYIPHANVYGIDITLDNLKYGIDHENIKTFVMDGTKLETAQRLNTMFDVIIDDGSHLPEHQIAQLEVFAPYIKKGGIYVIEDIADYNTTDLQPALQQLADKHGLIMEWRDLRHIKQRFDDIVAIFRRY